jgi:hypothetical protein
MLEKTLVWADGEWIEWDHDKMIFIDIHEGEYGDRVTFEYNGITYVSYMRSG